MAATNAMIDDELAYKWKKTPHIKFDQQNRNVPLMDNPAPTVTANDRR